MMPPGFADAIADMNAVHLVVAMDDADAADWLSREFWYNCPAVKVGFLIGLCPVFQYSSGFHNVSMGAPRQILCHFRVICPVAEHGLRIVPREAAQQQLLCFKCTRAFVCHIILPPWIH